MTMYEFNAQLRKGQAHEATLDEYCGEWFDIVPATWKQQRQGIDRIFTDKATGKVYAVEYKADETASKTGNAFVETVSVDTQGKPGWAVASKADWLLYYLPADRLIYQWGMAELRVHLPRWEREYPRRSIPNRTYNTIGILVPLDEFERYARKTVSF